MSIIINSINECNTWMSLCNTRFSNIIYRSLQVNNQNNRAVYLVSALCQAQRLGLTTYSELTSLSPVREVLLSLISDMNQRLREVKCLNQGHTGSRGRAESQGNSLTPGPNHQATGSGNGGPWCLWSPEVPWCVRPPGAAHLLTLVVLV